VGTTGDITAKQAGEAIITARAYDGGHSATCQVVVYDEIQAPEGFSPNGDGINDYFELLGDSRETYAIRIFDKSGQVYYTSENYKNDWDGVANTGPNSGKKVLPGTYFYTVTAKNTNDSKTGYVVVKY
jgi:gliding motility-associated-like protein